VRNALPYSGIASIEPILEMQTGYGCHKKIYRYISKLYMHYFCLLLVWFLDGRGMGMPSLSKIFKGMKEVHHG
jgi:hypothetical protein